MYFISKLYQGVKGLVAITGATGSVLAIVYGTLQSGGTIFIIGGSLCLANSLFNIIEIGKVDVDIRKQIKLLEGSIHNFIEENRHLEENVTRGRLNNQQYAEENKKLRALVHRSEQNIQKLEELQQKILKAKNSLQRENEDLSKTNAELRTLRDQYAEENSRLKNVVIEIKQQVNVIEDLKNKFAMENQELANNNKELTTQMSRQADIIVESKKLIQNLAQFGDRYTAFGETLGKDVDRLENTTGNLDTTANILKNLVTKLQSQTFETLDINNDGIITSDEFQQGLEMV